MPLFVKISIIHNGFFFKFIAISIKFATLVLTRPCVLGTPYRRRVGQVGNVEKPRKCLIPIRNGYSVHPEHSDELTIRDAIAKIQNWLIRPPYSLFSDYGI
jgi:hypothetical protein